MTIKQKWERLPKWVPVTVYTVLGLAALAAVSTLGVWLAGMLFRTGSIRDTQTEVFFKLAGALILLSVAFGGIDSGRQAKKKRNHPSHTNVIQ